MKTFLFSLTLLVCPAFGEPPMAHLPPITLYAEFPKDPPETTIQALQNELMTIMGPVGLQFEWRSLAESRAGEVSVELAVVKFRGKCDASTPLAGVSTQPGALGRTHVSDGVILPFSDVDCDAVRGFLRDGLSRTAKDERDAVYGRALARVLAHELYHIFAGTQDHGKAGVAKPRYTTYDLLSDSFIFEETESEAMRISKSTTAPEVHSSRN